MEIVLLVYGRTYKVLPEVKNAKGAQAVMEEEGRPLEKFLNPSDVLILLDENGRSFSSEKMAEALQKQFNRSPKRLVFAIGGPYGFGPQAKERADDKWSLSSLTFNHQMVRTIFLEQLYRCFTILNNEPYHHQ